MDATMAIGGAAIIISGLVIAYKYFPILTSIVILIGSIYGLVWLNDYLETTSKRKHKEDEDNNMPIL